MVQTASQTGLLARAQRSILIAMARKGKNQDTPGSSALGGGQKSVLVVLFVPSVERDGATPIDQDFWVNSALELLGRIFGGATAYPKARGIWRDDERAGALVKDEPVLLHCYTTPEDIQDLANPLICLPSLLAH